MFETNPYDQQIKAAQAQNYAAGEPVGYTTSANGCLGKALRNSPQEDAELNFRHHSEQAQKAGEAAKFLALHPEFNRFIELVRQGAIQF